MEAEPGPSTGQRGAGPAFPDARGGRYAEVEPHKGKLVPRDPTINRQENNMGPVDWFGRNMVANLPKDVRVGVINVSVAGAGIQLWDKDKWRNISTQGNRG